MFFTSDVNFSTPQSIAPDLWQGMICMIDGKLFYTLTKNTCFVDLEASCHIANKETGMYDVTDINESINSSYN